jgi:hypothetical protein
MMILKERNKPFNTLEKISLNMSLAMILAKHYVVI